jgi:four helix bundle suffix protein
MTAPTAQSDPPNRSDPSDHHHRLRPSGGYRQLRSFQTATVIYDATVAFCERYVDPKSRTRDQMVQAARSGRQNIAEGSRAAATSSQTELRLVNVARASLDELLLDFEDFLRQRGKRLWAKDDPEAQAVRQAYRAPTDRSGRSDPSAPYSPWLTSPDPAIVANAIICLIHQTNYLLDQQVRALELGFVQVGGYTEQLAAARIAFRQQTDRSDPSDRSASALPSCPLCGKPMALRTAHKGARAGSQFWGCTGYPECKGTRNGA